MDGSRITNGKLLYSFDIDSIMGYSKEQLDGYLKANEREIIELLDQNTDLLRRIKKLETDIEHYKSRISTLEAIKIEQKAAIPVWKSIAVAAAAFGALVMSIFMGNNDNKVKP
jgi:cell division septum initiation protein DivIVA